MMSKVKTTYAYKIQPIVKKFPDEMMESINNQLYCNLCNCAVSCNKRFLVDSHRNRSKHQKALGSRSENLKTIIQQSAIYFILSLTLNTKVSIELLRFKAQQQSHYFTCPIVD